MSRGTDVRQLVRKLKKQGYQVIHTPRGSHWEVRTQRGERIATFPSSPGDNRWRDNAIADIRRWERAKGMPLTSKALHHHVPMNYPKEPVIRTAPQDVGGTT